MTRAVARPSSDEAGSPQTASPSSVVISWFRLTSRSSAMRASLRVERRRHPQQQTTAVAGFLALRSLSPGAALDGVAHRPPSVSLPHVHGLTSPRADDGRDEAADHRRDPRRRDVRALTFSRISDETMDATFQFVYDDGGDAANVEAATDRAQKRLVGRSGQCSCLVVPATAQADDGVPLPVLPGPETAALPSAEAIVAEATAAAQAPVAALPAVPQLPAPPPPPEPASRPVEPVERTAPPAPPRREAAPRASEDERQHLDPGRQPGR